MHLVEQYALSCGAKINRGKIRDKYCPLPADRYITFSPFSKPSKNYDYWKEVLAMVIPPLNQLKIKLVQLGEKSDPAHEGCLDMRGKTSIAQAAYLIKRGVMHVGTDSFATHIASAYDKKIVSLYSHSPIQNCGPFWSKKSDIILLESNRKGLKHSYATEEKPKTINTIEPEKIAYSIFKILGIDTNIKHKTVHIGPKWNMEFLEVVPSAVAKFSQKAPKDRHVIRMDYHFNEEVMIEQLKANPGLIVTNNPVSLDKLIKVKDLIDQVIYFVEDDSFDVEFSRALDRANIKNSIYTNLEGEFLKKLKYDLLNLNKPIATLEKKSKELIYNHEKYDVKNLKFRSRKFVIEGDKIFPGKAAYFNNVAIDSFNADPIPVINKKDFWDEMDFFWITEDQNLPLTQKVV
jgi:hypothetical protein